MRNGKRRRGTSQGLQYLGREIVAEYGIAPLKPGESRPDDFLTPNHYWGPTSLKIRSLQIEDRPWYYGPVSDFLVSLAARSNE